MIASVATVGSCASCTEQLARFFPETERVRTPAILRPLRSGGRALRESVLIEFASSQNAIFASELPLDFDEVVRLQQSNGGATAEARVVAVQYQDGRKAVAVRFENALVPWVNRP